MKRLMIDIVLVALLACCLYLLWRWRSAYYELYERSADNIRALTTEVELTKYHDSLTMASAKALRLEASELSDLRSDYARLAKSVGASRAKDVRSVVATESLARDTIYMQLPDCSPIDTPIDTCVNHHDYWSDVSLCLCDDTASVTYSVRDSLTTVVYVTYRKRFLWWRWKPEYRATTISHNPRTTILSQEATVVED